MSADNAALVRRWFHEVWNLRRPELAAELLTDESFCLADEGEMRGAAGFLEQQYTPFVAAFPDLKVVVEGVIAQGDEVAVRWSATGTHTGDGLGFPPTQESVTFRGMTWVVVRDGKLGEGWQSSNIPEVIGRLSQHATI